MAYIKPQVIVFQEFRLVPTEVTEPLRAFILGGNAKLHRYSDLDEKELIQVGEYNRLEDTCYSWPDRTAGAIVDRSYAKVYVDDALLLYYEDLIGQQTTIDAVTGRSNWIESDSLAFKSNGTAYPRSAVFNDRDVKVGDVVYLRGVYDPEDTCEEIELWTSVKGFASVAVESEIEPARWDDDNQETVTADATIEQVAGAENCVIASVDGDDYDGLASGNVTEEYTIEVIKSSISGCNAARLRVTSASGLDDVDEVTPADFGDPTDIGDRGLKVTFNNTGNDDCSSEASLGGFVPTDFVVGQKWVVNVTQAFEQVYALAGGTYDGAKNDIYIIEVTKGGEWADLPEITIRTSKGLDHSGPTEVTDSNIEIPIGTHGLTVTLFGSGGGDDDLSIGADICAGLRKGDKFYITVNAEKAGQVRRLILKHDVPVKLRGLADLDLRLFIKDNIELPINRLDAPPLTNYYLEDTQICLQEGAMTYHSSWTDGGVELPLELWDGTVFVEYREWLDAETDTIGSVSDVADLDQIPGQIDPDNPLKYGVLKALQNANGTAVKYIAVSDPSDVDAWQDAIAKAKGREDLYNYVPLTYSKAIQDLCQAQAEAESGPTVCNWKASVFSLKSVASKVLVGQSTSSDEDPVLATLGDDPQATGSQYTLLTVTSDNASLLSSNVDAGDIVRYLYVTDGFGNESYEEFVVDEVLSESTLRLFRGSDVAVNEPQKIEIIHNLNKNEIVEDLVGQAGAWSNRRVLAVWPDVIGNAGVDLPGYYLAAAIAGLASGVMPHQPLTNVEIVGFDDASKSFTYFTSTQLDRLSEGGVWVVTEDKDGTIHTRDATTTDNTDLNRRSESIRRNVDSISSVFTRRLRPLIGRTNVSPAMLRRLEMDIIATMDYLSRSGDTEETGPQLISGKIRTLQVSPLARDRVEIVLDLVVPAPLNHIELHLVI